MDIFKKELWVIFLSTLPLIELRGAIPIGISLGLSMTKSILLGVLGNLAIIPILLVTINPLVGWLEKTRIFSTTIGRVKKSALRKTKDKIKKYSSLGLFFFVALPLPGTGVWTGSLAALILRLDPFKAGCFMGLGVIVAGILVGLISQGTINILN